MAKEDGKPTATDKGKGKAVDGEEHPNHPEADKDGKATTNGAKPDLPPEELSEEDQQLKSDLDMLVERIQGDDPSLYRPALEKIKEFIKTSTSSMTAVPKPLKFLRPHYESLEKTYESWPEGDDKVGLTPS